MHGESSLQPCCSCLRTGQYLSSWLACVTFSTIIPKGKLPGIAQMNPQIQVISESLHSQWLLQGLLRPGSGWSSICCCSPETKSGAGTGPTAFSPLTPSWLLDFPVSFEEWWEAFILFWSQDQTLFLDLKPGIMTKPLTLGVAYHYSQRGQLTPQNLQSESSVHRCFLQRNEVHSRPRMGNLLYSSFSYEQKGFSQCS